MVFAALYDNNHDESPSEGQLEPTQVESQGILDIDWGVDTENKMTDIIRPWAKLVSLSSMGQHIDLYGSPADDKNRINVHTFGRSPKCHSKFIQQRVSNFHCTIFCQKYQDNNTIGDMEVFIEDSSANGTYLNRIIRLKKHTPCKLHNGDEISLINPELNKINSDSITEDILQTSFVIKILRFDDTTASLYNFHNNMNKLLNQNMNKKLALKNKTNSVHKLLEKERMFKDYYTMKGDEIGSGTSGKVYLCIQKETGEEFAVKLIDTKPYQPDISVLLQEAELIRSIDCKYIIKLIDIFYDHSTLYLVMELLRAGCLLYILHYPKQWKLFTQFHMFSYYRNTDDAFKHICLFVTTLHWGDLFDRIALKQFYRENEAVVVLQQVLLAMEYLHTRHIAHRDLKPENILLSSLKDDVKIKITDFGLAKKVDASGRMRTFCGTPNYYAPEVLRRQKTTKGIGSYSLEADMWSVGVILFILLNGHMPWSETTMDTQIEQAAYFQSGNRWDELSQAVKDLIDKLLQVDPSKRLTATAALQHPWFSLFLLPPTDNNNSSSSTSSSKFHDVQLNQHDVRTDLFSTTATATPPVKLAITTTTASNSSVDRMDTSCSIPSSSNESISTVKYQNNLSNHHSHYHGTSPLRESESVEMTTNSQLYPSFSSSSSYSLVSHNCSPSRSISMSVTAAAAAAQESGSNSTFNTNDLMCISDTPILQPILFPIVEGDDEGNDDDDEEEELLPVMNATNNEVMQSAADTFRNSRTKVADQRIQQNTMVVQQRRQSSRLEANNNIYHNGSQNRRAAGRGKGSGQSSIYAYFKTPDVTQSENFHGLSGGTVTVSLKRGREGLVSKGEEEEEDKTMHPSKKKTTTTTRKSSRLNK